MQMAGIVAMFAICTFGAAKAAPWCGNGDTSPLARSPAHQTAGSPADESTWAGVVIHANIVQQDPKKPKYDPRGPLSKIGRQAGASQAVIARIRKTSGYCTCPGPTRDEPYTGSCWLAGDGDEIRTAAHVFFNEHGLPIKPLADCFFQNQDKDNPERIAISAVPGSVLALPRDDPAHHGQDDEAIAKLIARIPGDPKPFPIELSVPPIEQKLLVVSAAMMDLSINHGLEPIAQICWQEVPGSDIPVGKNSFYTNCACKGASSGSATYVQLRTGDWAIIGMVVGTGDDPDFTPFHMSINRNLRQYEGSYCHHLRIAPDDGGFISIDGR